MDNREHLLFDCAFFSGHRDALLSVLDVERLSWESVLSNIEALTAFWIKFQLVGLIPKLDLSQGFLFPTTFL